ncbi:MAG TPA: hypothetical protein DCR43_08945 [Bacteroidales bacterium]|nr:MAG: hypothetical protein A2X11_05070 [Bacteroidetes bacterium GWE2_42_24]OFY26609.1 MAG: hypothetical protein A2X09_03500 [Bacteroidetes bacterium GWF2_43_11]HAQ65959.1 hypothetical protein [Bacteroidales bacterium]HBZ67491.1 hypothetical protein [Bacteroidales bacterium]
MENKDQLNQIPEDDSIRQEENTLEEQNIVSVTSAERDHQPLAEPVVEVSEVKANVDIEIPEDVVEQILPAFETISEEPAVEAVVEVSVVEVVAEEPSIEAVAEESVVEVVAEESAVELGAEEPAVVIPELSEVLTLPAQVLPIEDEEDEDEDDELSLHDVDQYEHMSRAELVDILQQLVQQDDFNEVRGKIAQIKVVFIRKSKQLHTDAYEAFIAAGGEKEAYVPADDVVEHLFKSTFGIYREKKQQFAEALELVKQKNLEAKNQILEELRSLINSDDNLKKTYDEFKFLQDKWKQIGVVPKADVNSLWQSYHFLVEKFFDKVRINKELKDLDLKKNLEAKVELCERAEELLLETSILESFKALQKLHDQWKEIGPVPQDKKEEVWDRFKLATDKINNRRREYYDNIHAELQTNLDSKNALIEKAAEVLSVPAKTVKEWQERTDTVNEMFKIWKSIGPAPRKINDEVWLRFKAVLDDFFTAKSDYFSNIKEQQITNYNLKLELCLQAEALQSSTDWRNTSRELINLQKEWKNIGPVPRKHSDKIWKRFRTACDGFFQAKSTYLSNIHGHETENMAAKVELLRQAEVFSPVADKAENLHALKDFQRKWMEIGHVPIKEKDRLQAEFRKAIDKLMDRLNITNLDMNAVNFKNRFEGMKDAPEGQRTIQKEISFLQGKIQKMSEDMSVWENNIGFLANSKNANLLKEEFEKKIEKARLEIRLLEAKVKFLRDELNK